MRFFGFWTIFVALIISAIAAYYSIVGLIAIFAAAVVPVIVMGTALEVGKITSAVWLHTHWTNGKALIKLYLIFAVILLMFITSMGIFGFLSKAHIEQTSQATEGVAQLERLTVEITRAEGEILRAEQKINKLDTADTTQDDSLQLKIETEEKRIDTVYNRLSTDIEFTQTSMEAAVAPYVQQSAQHSATLTQIGQYIQDNNIRALQGLIGAQQDGKYGTKTADKVSEFRTSVEKNNNLALYQIKSIRDAAQQDITKLRTIADNTIAQSNKLIDRLREQVGVASDSDVEQQVDIQRDKIKTLELTLDTLFDERYSIEGEARKLEAEVGPVKYIAEIVYGADADRDALEMAVRWVIFILVIVFDPLAIVLVIAGITLIEQYPRKQKVVKEVKKKEFDPILETKKDLIPTKLKFSNKKHADKPTLIEARPATSNVIQPKAIEFQGVVYQPTDFGYQRIKEQIDLNNYERKINDRSIVVNTIISQMKLTDPTVNADVVKEQIEYMFNNNADAEELVSNAKNMLEAYNKATRDTKK